MSKELKPMNIESADITADNIKKLKDLFPEIVTEKKIDFEKLRLILGDEVDESPERYNFTWNGKKRAMKFAQKPTTATLKPKKDKSKNWDDTKNIYIEGDNLEVLKLLQKSYSNRIKMIYVDPPYNTGKDFLYKDNFHEPMKNYMEQTGQMDGEGLSLKTNIETSGRFHTDWLNMIMPRLKLARNLLSDDGVMFISIDDAEVDNLTKIIKEVFGESTFVMPLIWRLPRGINAGLISKAHEYILVVTKSVGILKHFNFFGEKEYSIDRTNKKIDGRHPASIIHFPANKVRYEGKNQVLTNEISGSEKVIIHGEMILENGYLTSEVDLEAGWTMKKMITDWLDGKEVYDTKGQKIVEFFFKENGKLQSKKDVSTQIVKSVLDGIPDNQMAREEINSLFGEQDIFSYPKPSGLVKYLAGLVLEDDDIILDFFSGSGTTAQAIVDLNDELEINANWIMVQLPENLDYTLKISSGDAKTTVENAINMCEKLKLPHSLTELAIERIKRVIEKSNNVNLHGFKVFELSESNLKKWSSDVTDLNQQIEMQVDNFNKEIEKLDVVYEIMLKQGLDLNLPIKEEKFENSTLYNLAYGSLFIVLGENIKANISTKIATLIKNENLEDVSVVFQDTGFSNDSEKLNSIEILNSVGVQYDDILSI